MPLQLPCRLCADVADRLVGSLTIESAYESIRTVFHQATSADLAIFVRKNHRWQRLAGRTNAVREMEWQNLLKEWQTLLAKVDDVPPIVTPIGEGANATAIWVADDEPMVVMLEHDWSHESQALETCAKIIELAIRRIRAEQRGRRLQRIVRPALRLTRDRAATRDQGLLAQSIVERIATMFNAERVSIALFSPEEQALKIVAARGIPDEVVARARIKPGEWALGHAYATSKVMAITDVRLLPSRSPLRARYKTHSFAAIPLMFGHETLGVMCITDRRDGETFLPTERATLRLIGMTAGAALAAAGAHQNIQRLEHKASIDSVTGLFNRGYLDTRLLEEVERSQRERTQLAVLIADIDDFKPINDTFGHQTGDAVLKQVGEIIRSAVRMFDVCARFGGDEFAVLMPNSDRASAFACADRIRKIAAQYANPNNPSFPQLTVSVGVAVGDAQDGAAALVARADRALYQAKAAGKNAVRGAQEQEEWPSPVGTADAPPDSSSGTPHLQLPYMLVADAAGPRQDIYTAVARQHRLGLLIARDAHQALRLIHQFGPPILLIADLGSPDMLYLALHTISQKEREAQVVAFSSTRDVRDFFRAVPNAGRIHVVNRSAANAVVQAVLTRVLSAVAEVAKETSTTATEDPWRAQAVELTARAGPFLDVAGAAAYWKDPDSGKMRAVVRWTGESNLDRCQYFLPRAVDHVFKRGEAVTLGDVGATARPHADRTQRYAGGHALMAAPIMVADEVVAAVSVFDDVALQISEESRRSFEETVAKAATGHATNRPTAGDTPSERPPENPRTYQPAVEPALPAVERRMPSPEAPPTLLERQRGEFEVARELARSRREQRQMSVVLFDISQRLMQQREAAVESATDSLLQSVVDAFVRTVRQSDLPIRWSGNELLLVLPGVAGVEARAVAERVRAAMEAGGRRQLLVSGGVAELERDEQLGTVVERARAKVAESLERGENRVS
jgi:diguanylate cyclase (GGDEF)-like protein